MNKIVVAFFTVLIGMGCGLGDRHGHLGRDGAVAADSVATDSVVSAAAGDASAAASADAAVAAAQAAVVPRWKRIDTALFFAGVYVNEDYVKQIVLTKSPSRHQNYEQSCIEIPDSTMKVTRMVGGFHDGAGDMVVVKDGERYLFCNRELTVAQDTIEALGGGRLRIGRTRFVRMQHPDVRRGDWGILEEFLFMGVYEREDGRAVSFEAGGVVKGLGGVAFYEPVIDYADMDYATDDLIRLGMSNRDAGQYGFRWHGDTLRIYDLKCARKRKDDCDSMGFGEMMWALRKKGSELK